ncbi:NADP-dependent oxidoreductase, L4bD family protein [Pseudooceanicola batsensis HTCC2597]|uniref:NADP-dependent oxidoreductase, L4bD family protein n=2 Tax=Pseudooceanicola batsensis TaxID=314255 RepID=A3TW38_PSEBH|nr:NADP-dependent oxidoreductase, L4bD family protein [Pseudooceanicola batsensis HTCC2597]
MKHIVLAKRPEGAPTDENFRLEDAPVPEPGEGEVLVKVKYMSLDPYMRGRMDDGPSYAAPVEVGSTMEGGAVGEVIASNDPKFQPGDHAFGMFGWATHGVQPARMLRKVNPDDAPIQTSLGVLGMPGFTAWAGMTAYSRMKEGETLVVGAATGPVGSMVGQLAKQAGLRVIGVAGGEEKCKMAVETFGFDACVDHRGKDARAMREALKNECPDGIDIYFENVGGPTLGGVIPLLNLHARVIVCGMIAWYSGESDETGSMPLQKLWRHALVKRLTIQGLLQTDHVSRFGDFLREVAPKVASGDIVYVEDVEEGLENAPEAFMGLLKGRNQGKLVVKVD